MWAMTTWHTLLTILALVFSYPAWASGLPDPVLTPGAINLNVTQENIQQTVCVKGYTKTIRPPVYYTNKLKKQQIREYGYADINPKHYEEDHLIALSIGGAADDPLNLWPQPRNNEWGAEKKDQLEKVLYKKVCAKKITLADAQHVMATNWIAAWKRYMLPVMPFQQVRGKARMNELTRIISKATSTIESHQFWFSKPLAFARDVNLDETYAICC